jgi:hypothetical protein
MKSVYTKSFLSKLESRSHVNCILCYKLRITIWIQLFIKRDLNYVIFNELEIVFYCPFCEHKSKTKANFKRHVGSATCKVQWNGYLKRNARKVTKTLINEQADFYLAGNIGLTENFKELFKDAQQTPQQTRNKRKQDAIEAEKLKLNISGLCVLSGREVLGCDGDMCNIADIDNEKDRNIFFNILLCRKNWRFEFCLKNMIVLKTIKFKSRAKSSIILPTNPNFIIEG